MANYQYVNDLWNDTEAAKLSGVDRLVYRSNMLGADQRITNTGGGNTSSKLIGEGSAHRRRTSKCCGSKVPAAICAPRAREFLLALSGQADRPAEDLRRARRTRA